LTERSVVPGAHLDPLGFQGRSHVSGRYPSRTNERMAALSGAVSTRCRPGTASSARGASQQLLLIAHDVRPADGSAHASPAPRPTVSGHPDMLAAGPPQNSRSVQVRTTIPSLGLDGSGSLLTSRAISLRGHALRPGGPGSPAA